MTTVRRPVGSSQGLDVDGAVIGGFGRNPACTGRHVAHQLLEGE